MAANRGRNSRGPPPGGRVPGRSSSPVPGRSSSPGPGGRSSSRRPSAQPEPAAEAHRLVKPQDVTQVFKKFDINGDGNLDRQEIAAVLKMLDPVKWTDRNATLLLMSMDSNFDGKIDYSEFVEWVSKDGSEQAEFRDSAGMPRSRAEMHQLEMDRKAASEKGTVAELEQKRAVAAHRLENVKGANDRLKAARKKHDGLKADAAAASDAFLPTYNLFKSTSEVIALVPAKELLEKEMKAAYEDNPPASIELAAQAMCCLFHVVPSIKRGTEPDYWTAFLEAVLNGKLIFQMDKFNKEHMSIPVVQQVIKICKDERFTSDKVEKDVEKISSTSKFLLCMCLWVQFLGKYAEAGVSKLWDQVYRAETDLKREEVDVSSKEEAYASVKREVHQLEAALKV